ncbi:uncharacterized protein F4812DRAFT_463434 [Daldinia caldariorum]|uniref:uncharacterized protein n=1 Tax=Daldinia caldariorum TaxID=326644 RepID=UPI0020077BAD|nr:uncharacterized protein F4812DRAFT_463434 [Daldinia caldariorum]KAI1463608.1 hypothetical protein F4812DRAFT_463434 [Daldinia caldariorum]
MATITLEKTNVPVKLPEGLSEEKLLGFSPFNNWVATLTRSLSLQHTHPAHPFHADPYSLRAITIQSFDLFGRPPRQRLGFLKLVAEITNGAGASLPGAVFLRGPSVAILVVLVPDDGEGERYVVLTVQPRIPAGSLAFVELPAGMVDEGGTFVGAAAQEIKEELGLEIPASELRCLSDLVATTTVPTGGKIDGVGVEGDRKKEEGQDQSQDQGQADENLPLAMYPSPGGCDEHIPIFMYERRVPRETLKEWSGKLTGLRDEGEMITLKLIRMRDLWKEGARDAKCLAAVALWEGLRREGKI